MQTLPPIFLAQMEMPGEADPRPTDYSMIGRTEQLLMQTLDLRKPENKIWKVLYFNSLL